MKLGIQVGCCPFIIGLSLLLSTYKRKLALCLAMLLMYIHTYMYMCDCDYNGC